jgi:cell division protein ZapA
MVGVEAKTKVGVRIADKEYILAGSEPEQYILNLAYYVDRKIAEMLKVNPMLSTSMAAVLTSVNVADEYFKTVETERNAVEGFLKVSGELQKVKEELSQSKKEIELLRQHNRVLDSELSTKEAELERREEELRDFKVALDRTSKIRFYTKGS